MAQFETEDGEGRRQTVLTHNVEILTTGCFEDDEEVVPPAAGPPGPPTRREGALDSSSTTEGDGRVTRAAVTVVTGLEVALN